MTVTRRTARIWVAANFLILAAAVAPLLIGANYPRPIAPYGQYAAVVVYLVSSFCQLAASRRSTS
jgi:hypothetical protein